VGHVTAITHLSSTPHAARFVDHRAVALAECFQEPCAAQAPRHPARFLMPSPSSRYAKILLGRPPWGSRKKLEQGLVYGTTRIETPAHGLEVLSLRVEEIHANDIVC
jgi:hypothetical protein